MARAATRPLSTAAAPSFYATLRRRVRAGDADAYLCGSLLPSAARDAFFAVRALNLELAGVRDAARGNVPMARLRFAFWRDLVAEAFSGRAPAAGSPRTEHPLFAPLAASAARHRLTRRWLDRLIEAREADLEGRAPATVAALEAYAEATHGSLLYLTLEAAGVRDVHADHAASHIGKAAGLAMVIRALPLHARLGQRYVPDDVLAKVRGGRKGGKGRAAGAFQHKHTYALTRARSTASPRRTS